MLKKYYMIFLEKTPSEITSVGYKQATLFPLALSCEDPPTFVYSKIGTEYENGIKYTGKDYGHVEHLAKMYRKSGIEVRICDIVAGTQEEYDEEKRNEKMDETNS